MERQRVLVWFSSILSSNESRARAAHAHLMMQQHTPESAEPLHGFLLSKQKWPFSCCCCCCCCFLLLLLLLLLFAAAAAAAAIPAAVVALLLVPFLLVEMSLLLSLLLATRRQIGFPCLFKWNLSCCLVLLIPLAAAVSVAAAAAAEAQGQNSFGFCSNVWYALLLLVEPIRQEKMSVPPAAAAAATRDCLLLAAAAAAVCSLYCCCWCVLSLSLLHLCLIVVSPFACRSEVSPFYATCGSSGDTTRIAVAGPLRREALMGEGETAAAAKAFYKTIAADDANSRFTTEIFWLTIRAVRLCFK